jgi:hypothetical protein
MPRWRIIDKTLGLDMPEPPETYHTSPHLFTDLSIPEGVTSTLPTADRTRAGLGAEVEEDLGGGRRKGRTSRESAPVERAPRQRRRRRDGALVDPASPAAGEAAAADDEQPSTSEGQRSSAGRTRRRRRGGAAAPAAAVPTDGEARASSADGASPVAALFSDGNDAGSAGEGPGPTAARRRRSRSRRPSGTSDATSAE